MTGIAVYENQQNARLVVQQGVNALTVANFRHLCDALLARNIIHFVIDLSQTPTMDSAGIAALVSLYKQCRSVGGTMKIGQTMSPAAQRILRLTRFDHIFETVELYPHSMPEQSLRQPQHEMMSNWQNIDSGFDAIRTTIYSALQAVLNISINTFVQKGNRQFSVS